MRILIGLESLLIQELLAPIAAGLKTDLGSHVTISATVDVAFMAFEKIGKRGFMQAESWRLDWDGLQGGF